MTPSSWSSAPAPHEPPAVPLDDLARPLADPTADAVPMRPGLWGLLRDTVDAWLDDQAPSMGAALAYYTLFSIAPLLLLVIGVAGAVFGEDAARGEVFRQLSGLLGREGAQAVEEMLLAVQRSEKGFWSGLIGGLLLLVGATTVMVELQTALDRIWHVPPAERPSGIWAVLRSRVLSLALILALGFLLMVSLVVSAGMTAMSQWWSPLLSEHQGLLTILNHVVSWLMSVALFALIYKGVPSSPIAWRDVALGAVVSATLFSLGKAAIGWYLGTAQVASAFGAAGSVVVLMVWVYYSAQIFLLGAEFTWVYSLRRGSHQAVARSAAETLKQAEGATAPAGGNVSATNPTGAAA